MIIKPEDIQLAGMCVRGSRRWFLANGFTRTEFRTFIKEGLPAEVLLARGDALARLVVDRKQKRASNGR